MGTVTLKGSEYTYYVTTPASYTATPENLGSCLDAAFTPKITRNKTGDAFTRYFLFSAKYLTAWKGFALYSAKFTKTSKTATVTRLNADYYDDQGYYISRAEFVNIINGRKREVTDLWNFNSGLFVAAGTTVANVFEDRFASATISCPCYISGFNPYNMSIETNLTSSLPSEFGNVSGFISASIISDGYSNWIYTSHDGTRRNLVVGTESTLTANGRIETKSSDHQGRFRIQMDINTVPEELLGVSLFAKFESYDVSAYLADEVKLQPYSPPTLSSLKMTKIPLRGSTGVRIDASYALNSLNKESTETDEITTGYIRLKWYTTDENGDPVEGSPLNPNVYYICSDGDPLDSITGTCSIPSATQYDNESSYTVNAWIEDRLGGRSNILRYTMPTEFRTIDVYPGGRGIAFGAVADDEGFYCAMPASFNDYSDVQTALLDLIHPVGSYLWTSASPSDFDPNDVYGGTWQQMDEGMTLVSAGVTYEVDTNNDPSADGGEAKVTLTTDEMPSHNHAPYGGTKFMETSDNIMVNSTARAYPSQSSGGTHFVISATTNGIGEHAQTRLTGGGLEHENMPPYKAAYCWHRTA